MVIHLLSKSHDEDFTHYLSYVWSMCNMLTSGTLLDEAKVVTNAQ